MILSRLSEKPYFLYVLSGVTLVTASPSKITLASRKASLAANALQIYAIAKGVARDPRSAAVASLVANMKRDLGRRGRKAAGTRTAALLPTEQTVRDS